MANTFPAIDPQDLCETFFRCCEHVIFCVIKPLRDILMPDCCPLPSLPKIFPHDCHLYKMKPQFILARPVSTSCPPMLNSFYHSATIDCFLARQNRSLISGGMMASSTLLKWSCGRPCCKGATSMGLSDSASELVPCNLAQASVFRLPATVPRKFLPVRRAASSAAAPPPSENLPV